MRNYVLYGLVAGGIALAGCEAQGNYPGLEYAPQMYHTTPYEPLTQITSKEAGEGVSSREDGLGEFYNSNPYNPYGMNERTPPANTVRRNGADYQNYAGTPYDPNSSERQRNLALYLPYELPADSIEYASRTLKNPLDSTEAVVQAGQQLYAQFCYPCHGGAGQGDGPVGKVYKGVPAYNKGTYRDMTEGHIFHVITWGKGRMNPHGSQMEIADRWRIVRYVQTLQQQGE